MTPTRLLPACLILLLAFPASAATLTAAVAANLQPAFGEIQAAFRQASGHEIKPVFNSSGRFVAQIKNGAPFDLFLSADMMYPESLHKEGLTDGPPQVYAYGAVVLWTMKDIDLGQWQKALASPAVSRIAVASASSAPYGREALRALQTLGLEAALKPKLVFGESVAQTSQYIHSGVVDAGFTAKSVVLSPEMKGQGKWVDLPAGSYQPIAQGTVLLKAATPASREAARQFKDFLAAPPARAILQRYGYQLP
ncbi:molybdate transport system substrate-binding protein [Noviherbaspirillum humi]|uniref:Molybdate transport system substrate-binding protein n=1 Tax=Noviherbaspirillum humi TaxID=1688639 RepID=A0A239EAH0_9BURK|nr:molybdate ABC transporter substrate-binding protein [Noviherbaspirillum humi]SNS41461.1 molybdate transport system substrate-binding protein [Noviherbaspirillum humi]